MEKFNIFGLPINPCVQLDTSIYSISLNCIDIATDTEPQFMEDNDEPLNYFRSSDPLYYKNFTPMMAEEFEENSEDPRSEENANELNPLL